MKQPKVIKAEIDYDKLAKAVYKAIKVSEKKRIQGEEDLVLVKSIEKAIKNIKDEEDRTQNKLTMTSDFFRFIPLLFFGICAFVAYFILIVVLVIAFSNTHDSNFLGYLIIALLLMELSTVFGFTAHEIYHIKNINLLFNINSSIISIIALIIAIATLIITYQGVKS